MKTQSISEIAFLTMHGKEDIIKHCVTDPLQIQLIHTDAFNTDKLGTFTRDVERTKSQLHTARAKAILAMDLTGAEYGLGSEGAFGNGPYGALLPWHTEVLCHINMSRDIEILAWYNQPGFQANIETRQFPEVESFCYKQEFPNQKIVLSLPSSDDIIIKGIDEISKLEKAFKNLLASSEEKIRVELDLRAHFSPKRRTAIKEAAHKLKEALASMCPKCDLCWLFY